MGFFHREDAFLFATLSARDWGSIEITALLPAALESGEAGFLSLKMSV
jgi:hypothetical protein